jgi:hypothetical protein
MNGDLNELLHQPVSEEDKAVILDLLKRKMTVSLELAVQLLHAMEKRFGPEARLVVKQMALEQEFPPEEEFGDPADDLCKFCAMVDRAAAGSHRWERVIDEPGQVAYHFYGCMYAEILRELAEPELGMVICSRDGPWVKSYNPGLGFRRTKTLMQGQDCCDHVFLVEEYLPGH